ncbi:MAG: DUF3108 domain-containing protein [Proteiniphilum sp.]|jgi:hypothetical protein|nr:DUF3108 domain-containing protein [Proteiniphilum sp.]
MQKYIFRLFIIILSFSGLLPVNAQCKLTNTAFQSGENVQYDLYFDFGILSARAGRGSLQTMEANYRGVNAFKTVMMLNTSGLAGNLYMVNDTLTSYIDYNLRPLLFTKEAKEGKDYSVERQSFTYEGDKINIRALRNRNHVERFDEVVTTDKCTYDYLSVISYVRNLDYTGMKKGDKHYIQFISGKRPVDMYVNYLGTSSIKANNGKTYEVINISMNIQDDAFTDPKESLSASLTNDKNRIPVIINTSLKLGSVRAIMRDVSGVRH